MRQRLLVILGAVWLLLVLLLGYAAGVASSATLSSGMDAAAVDKPAGGDHEAAGGVVGLAAVVLAVWVVVRRLRRCG